MSAVEAQTLPADQVATIALSPDDTGAELKRGAIFNTVAMLASNFRGIFTFLIARLLGPAALGTFSVAWANIDLISKISVFGLDNAITTFIARAEANGDKARSRALFRAAVLLVLAQSIVVAAAAIFVLNFFRHELVYPPELLSALAFLFCALPGVGLYRVSTSISRGRKIMQHDIFSRGLTEPSVTTIAFLLALWSGAKFAPEIGAIVGTGASGIVAYFCARRLFSDSAYRERPHPARAEFGPLLRFAAPICAYQLVNAFIFRLDVIMLGWFVGRAPGVSLATVGVYGAVVDIAGGLRKVNQSFNPIFAPVVAGLTETGDHSRAAATYSRIAQWMLWILLPLVGVMTFAGSVILLIYGKDFKQGATWLAIVAAGCATNAFVSLGETVIMVQRPRLNLVNSTIACVIAFLANLWLIPRYGVTGAAIGILLPYIIQGILRFIVLRFIFHWRNDWSLMAPPIITAIVAAVPGAVCYFTIPGLPGQLAAAAVFLLVCGIGWIYRHPSRKLLA
jgi:O-antigen/teichoic acid export membrane protein